MSHRLAFAGAYGAVVLLGLTVGAPRDAAAQEVIVPPPPEVIATVQPVYYEGHPAYWYGGHWYWRDPHGWHSYANEPAYLRDHRMHGPPARYHYEGHGGYHRR
jgi:hypothetical protein